MPRQLLVRSPKARNKVTDLPHHTSLLDVRAALPARADREEKEAWRIFSLESALIKCSPAYFSNRPTDVRAALVTIRDASGLLRRLLDGGHTTIAGRLAGAFRNGGRDRMADKIVKTMSAASYAVRENDPFADKPPLALPVRLFTPSVTSGLLHPADLVGYRNGQVYIRKSMHVPLNRDAVRDAMPAFFDLLREEPDAGVRAVLGHFVFVYIHPYIDGNGRMGRFLMNAMMASGGYPWTVIPVGERTAYMHALEKASVGEDIGPFADSSRASSGSDWPAGRCPRFRRVDRYVFNAPVPIAPT